MKKMENNAQVTIKNNTYGTFYASNPNNGFEISLDVNQSEVYFYHEIFANINKIKKYFKNFDILIVDVSGTEKDVLDVAKSLGLKKEYESIVVEMLLDDDIDVEDDEINVFQAFLEKHRSVDEISNLLQKIRDIGNRLLFNKFIENIFTIISEEKIDSVTQINAMKEFLPKSVLSVLASDY